MKKFYKNKVLVAAHRGNSKYFPENTMASFSSALTLNIDMIENDLHMTKDGHIIVMHDPTVDRTTNGAGRICDMTFDEIRALDAGSWKDNAFAGEKVPSFEEFLELVSGRTDMMFNIELKDYPAELGNFAYESCDKILSMMEQYHISERSVINSWSGELLEYIDEKYNHKYHLHGYFPINLMGSNQKKNPYDYLYCICLFGNENDPVAAKEDFDYAKKCGVEPWVFYKTEEADLYQRAVENGAVLFTANDPAKADEVLKKLNVR